ncbi:MAG: pilus (MSHA type) biogenesis protein MshL [Thiobacillus sp.]|nr:pilus (MSHA type) biogenesis protein MshL [Thiobacillus sp.]
MFNLSTLNHTVLTALTLSSLVLVSGCVPPQTFDISPSHISQPAQPATPSAPPPAPVKAAPALAPPKLGAPVPTYTVVVNDVPVKDLLFSIARDTQYNIDLFPGITGRVSLNAVNEPLPSILDRIARQADLRYETHGKSISVMPDTPYPKTYRVNYVNVARNTTSSVGVAAQIASTGSAGYAPGQTSSGSSGGSGNSSSTTVSSLTNNDFWNVLADNLRSLLAGTRAIKQSGEEKAARLQAEKDARAERVSQTEAASKAGGGAATLFTAAFGNAPIDSKNDVAVNPMTGTVSVLGTSRQHEVVQQYLDSVTQTSQRQVMIEATIVEVRLKDQYRAGVNWTEVLKEATGWAVNTGGIATNLANTLKPFYSISYQNNNTSHDLTATIDLLESYGNTKVLSSPKLMALNNQTALLKVVDNLVYFTIEVQQGTLSSTGSPLTLPTYTTTANTVPVGVVMSVTPQIGDNGQVSLIVRPTISRVVSFKEDPNPALKQLNNNITNLVPEIQVREMESLLQVRSGQTVILGGLIQDDRSNARDGLPVLSRPEGFGALFGQHEHVNSQSELVIFLRPVVVSNPSLETSELRQFQHLLPSARSAQ